MNKYGWIGVDLDKTLAYRSDFENTQGIGEPLPEMVKKVKHWLSEGIEVRVFTARVGATIDPETQERERRKIKAWCVKHIGQELEVTATKDHQMLSLYDDRAVEVIPNTGLTREEFEAD